MAKYWTKPNFINQIVCPMEEECSEQASSYSWWWDSHNNSHQSQWLHSTLTDLDKKTKMMLNLIEEDGDSFVKRAEMFYEKKPQLIKMVEDLHKSYRSLAVKYDHLRSDSTDLLAPDHSSTVPLSSSSKKQVQHPRTTSTTRSPEITKVKPVPSFPKQEIHERNGIRGMDMEIKDIEIDLGFPKREEVRDEMRLKVSKLIEDNLRQQAELIRRNDEKRKIIQSLWIRVSRLMDENNALKSRIALYTDVRKQKQSPMSKLKEKIIGKSSR